MKVKNLLDGIKNTDIHDIIVILCGFVAVIIGVFNFFGIMPISNKVILELVTSAIGILLLSQFTINNKINRIISMSLNDKINIEYESIEKYIINSTSLDIYGIELYRDIDKYYSLLETLSEKSIKIRVLLADPNGDVINMVKLRYPTMDSSSSENILKTIGLLNELRKNKKSNIEIKKLDYLFSRKAYFVDPKKDNAVLFISNYTFRLAGKKAKYVFHKENKNDNYAFHAEEFELMWNAAKIVAEV